MKRKFKHLSIEERHVIYEGQKKGMTMENIGRSIGRSKSTVSTELKRNKNNNFYIPHTAQDKYDKRMHDTKCNKIDRDEALRSYVWSRLTVSKWAPDVIAGRMKETQFKNISTETIYHWIYTSPWAIARKLHLHLPTKRPKRLPRIARKTRVMIPARVSIHERDTIASQKKELGHFEIDLTFHVGNKSRNIGSFVDKTSQKIFLNINANKRAKTVAANFIKRLKNIPQKLRKTMTIDNGLEFFHHEKFKLLGFKTYFCDPYCSNQKPLVEKMNAMIHRILSKKIDIKKVTTKTIRKVEDILNNMPRRILGFKTPNEVWNEKMGFCSILN